METHSFRVFGQKIALNNLFAAPPEKATVDKFHLRNLAMELFTTLLDNRVCSIISR
jgi:hypothetical protein